MLDQVGTGRQEWRQLGCSFDLYLLVLVSTYRRSINSITGWNIGNIAAEVAYATTMAKVQPSLALENAREQNSERIRRPFAVLVRPD